MTTDVVSACDIERQLYQPGNPVGFSERWPHWQLAATYRDIGLVCFPLIDGKQPAIKSFPKFRRPPSLDAIARWNERWPTANIALLMRASGLIVIDVDSISALPAAIAMFGPTPLQVRTSRGAHLYYRDNQSVTAAHDLRSSHKLPIEIKAGHAAYVVAPGSVHKSGHIYAPENLTGAELIEILRNRHRALPRFDGTRCIIDGQPLTPLPIETDPEDPFGHCFGPAASPPRMSLAKGPDLARRRLARDLAIGGHAQPNRPPLATPDAIVDGERTIMLNRLLCQAVWRHADLDSLHVYAQQLNAEHCVPPMSDADVLQRSTVVWADRLSGKLADPGSSARHVATADDLRHIMQNAPPTNWPDAFAMLAKLRAEHGGRMDRRATFMLHVPNMAKAETMPGWGGNRYYNTIKILIDLGYVVRVADAVRGAGLAAEYILASPFALQPQSQQH